MTSEPVREYINIPFFAFHISYIIFLSRYSYVIPGKRSKNKYLKYGVLNFCVVSLVILNNLPKTLIYFKMLNTCFFSGSKCHNMCPFDQQYVRTPGLSFIYPFFKLFLHKHMEKTHEKKAICPLCHFWVVLLVTHRESASCFIQLQVI